MSDKRHRVRVDDDQYERLKEISNKTGADITWQVSGAIRDYLRKVAATSPEQQPE